MRNINETKTISDLLNTFTFGDKNSKGKSLSDTVKHSTIFSFWEDIAGKKLAQYTKPLKIKYSKLFISAKSPVIVQELNLSKQNILKKINLYSQALGIQINDISVSYKNYSKDENNFIPPDEKLEFYNDESFADCTLNDDFQDEIKKNISKINFLSQEQKDKLLKKIVNVKKAEIKRLQH